jgi:hypothetical protein
MEGRDVVGNLQGGGECDRPTCRLNVALELQ